MSHLKFRLLLFCFAVIVSNAQKLSTKNEIIDIINKVNNNWQINHPEPGNSFWDNAAYHTGNMEAFFATGNEDFRSYSEKWAIKNKWAGATSEDKTKWRYNYGEKPEYVLFGDWQICFQTYIDLYNISPDPIKIARACEVMKYQMSTPNNDYWWWADGLYMVMPVMTKLYKLTGDIQYLDKLTEYFKYAASIMYDEQTTLFYRDAKYVYPGHKTLNGKKDFWARGNGWVFAGLAKVLADMPKHYKHRDLFLNHYKTLADAIVNSQLKQGYWTRSMLDPKHAPGYETSGTAFFTYGLFWGINNGYLNEKKYYNSALRGWNYLSTVALQSDGKVGYVQPIGEKAIPGQVVNANSTANFGVGAFLLASVEVLRYTQNYYLRVKQPKIKTLSSNIDYVPAGFPVNFSLITHGNQQFVAYYDSLHQLTVASRKLSSHSWNYQKLDSKVGWDSHNYISMAIDKSGYIHISGNMHSSPLIYFRSSKPLDISSLKQQNVMVGTEEDVTTYPEFLKNPVGDLIFHYRYGRSGNGYEIYNVFDDRTMQWKRLLDKPLTDGENQRNAYMQGPVLGPDGYYHIIWVWRESPDCSTNHTLSYARSKDMLHWESVRGESVQLPITLKDSVLVVDSTPEKGGLINIGIKIGFDSEKKILISYHKYDSDGKTQLFITRFKDGKWINRQLTHWNYRWDFKGMGTVVNELLLESPRTSRTLGELIVPYHHNARYGDGQIIVDERTFDILRTETYSNEYPASINRLESGFKGMLVNVIPGKGDLSEQVSYLLRWETLAPNRDNKPSGVIPPPSILKLYTIIKK